MEVTSVFTVLADKEPPVIKGVKPIKVYKGDSAAYRKGVSVSDNADARPKLAINSAGVNLSKPGKYKLIYTATDLAGNKSSVQTTVEVLPRKPAGNEVIYQKVDEVLAKIIVKGMTTRQKVVAIYNWAKFNCHYSVKPPSSDYMQAAYFMLTHHTGNCFYYYSVTKLMFDRLGIKNLHVNKVKNHPGDSYHHWSMVSVDGGKTWYHFDATPRRGEGDDFCLVTDAFLDAYSKTHENCFNRDRSLYPATPAN